MQKVGDQGQRPDFDRGRTVADEGDGPQRRATQCKGQQHYRRLPQLGRIAQCPKCDGKAHARSNAPEPQAPPLGAGNHVGDRSRKGLPDRNFLGDRGQQE